MRTENKITDEMHIGESFAYHLEAFVIPQKKAVLEFYIRLSRPAKAEIDTIERFSK